VLHTVLVERRSLISDRGRGSEEDVEIVVERFDLIVRAKALAAAGHELGRVDRELDAVSLLSRGAADDPEQLAQVVTLGHEFRGRWKHPKESAAKWTRAAAQPRLK